MRATMTRNAGRYAREFLRVRDLAEREKENEKHQTREPGRQR